MQAAVKSPHLNPCPKTFHFWAFQRQLPNKAWSMLDFFPKQFRRVAFVHLLKAKYIWQIHRSWYSSIAYSPGRGKVPICKRGLKHVGCYMLVYITTNQQTKNQISELIFLPSLEGWSIWITKKNTMCFPGDFSLKCWFKTASYIHPPTSSTWGCKVTIPAISTKASI